MESSSDAAKVLNGRCLPIHEGDGHEGVARLATRLLWMVAAAALFLLGAANAGWHGLHQMTQLGVGGAIVALVVVAVFCDWQRPRLPGRS